jgi:hypothetical protein
MLISQDELGLKTEEKSLASDRKGTSIIIRREKEERQVVFAGQ